MSMTTEYPKTINVSKLQVDEHGDSTYSYEPFIVFRILHYEDVPMRPKHSQFSWILRDEKSTVHLAHSPCTFSSEEECMENIKTFLRKLDVNYCLSLRT